MRLPASAHTSQPWRIHDLTTDFRLEDVWALPRVGDGAEFARLVEMVASSDPRQSSSLLVRALFALREKLGEQLGWDTAGAGVGSRVATLRDRLPADLRDGPGGPQNEALPFTSLYLTGDEWAAELANHTVHGVIHLGRVPDHDGGFRVQMAVYVKPNGLLGSVYMAAIKPFRYLVVYPSILRQLERAWRAGAPTAATHGAPT